MATFSYLLEGNPHSVFGLRTAYQTLIFRFWGFVDSKALFDGYIIIVALQEFYDDVCPKIWVGILQTCFRRVVERAIC